MNPTNPDKRRAKITMLVSGIVIIVLIIILLTRHKTPATPVDQTTATTTAATSSEQVLGEATTSVSTLKTVTVTLTDAGYSPATVTINVGDTVKFVNNSSGKMWTASNPYPTHTDYPSFNEKTAANAGESFSFTFDQPGTWGYDNHLLPSQQGTIVVVSPGPTKD